MSEYWKSTPNYWCKFCSVYVRDTSFERKNHESSGKHQNNIQRSLRDLQKNKQREDRDKQRARDEVARLNGIVNGKATNSGSLGTLHDNGKILGLKTTAPASGPALISAAQRRAHAEQLVALGVELPEELKREVTGVGNWHTVSERVIEDDNPPAQAGKSLADIKAEVDGEQDLKKSVDHPAGSHKRKDDEEGEENGQDGKGQPPQKAWGNDLKSYADTDRVALVDDDLDALLGSIGKNRVDADQGETKPQVKIEQDGDSSQIKRERSPGEPDSNLDSVPVPVVFKKRKVRK